MGEDIRGRLIGGFLALVSVLVVGTVGYWLLGDGRWGAGECLYMTVITLTTVGYAEVLHGIAEVPYARAFTVGLIIAGMGVVLYFASTVTAFIIEGDLSRALRRGRMRKRIAKMQDHVIVCGAGSTGEHVVRELVATGYPTLVIDLDADKLEELTARFPKNKLAFLAGDATDDDILQEANLTAARGLVAALANDKDNLYLVVTARQWNPTIRIVARCIELSVADKLRRAGADSVVSPNHIGGMRLVSEMIRPTAVKFLDQMLRDREAATRIEEIAIGPGSSLVGRSLRESDLRRRARVSVLAVQKPGETGFVYNPDPDLRLDEGMVLVVLGDAERVLALRKDVAA